MKKLFYFLIGFLIGFVLFYSPIQAAEVVQPGHVITEKSIVFTMKEEKKLRENNNKRLKLEDLRIQHEAKIDIQQKRIVNLKEYVEDHKSLTTAGKIGWFFIGFLASSTATYVAVKVVNEAKR